MVEKRENVPQARARAAPPPTRTKVPFGPAQRAGPREGRRAAPQPARRSMIEVA